MKCCTSLYFTLGVGISCLHLRYTEDPYSAYISTIGVDFKFRTIDINGKRIKLQIWHSVSQRSATPAEEYYRSAHGIVLVYDITNKQTYDALGQYIKNARQNGNSQIVIMIVGNKCDLDSNRVVTTEQAQHFAKENDALFMEASGKTGTNVDKLFETVTRTIMNQFSKRYIDTVYNLI